MLKNLELHRCVYTSKHDEQVFDFFSGLPCLEDLWLDGVHSRDENCQNKIFRVSGLRLRTLNISCNQFLKIAINAPNLKSFVFHNCDRIVEFTELDLSSLDHVDVMITQERLVYYDPFVGYGRHVVNFFAGLGNVNSLVLRSPTLKVRRSEFSPSNSSY
ncbi:hypothetical protein LINPERPRIM_LOCUS36047 [Linum perenne]